MNIRITIPVAAVKAVLAAKKEAKKERHPIMQMKAHLPGKNYVKVEVETLDMLIRIVDSLRDEVDPKMKAKYGDVESD